MKRLIGASSLMLLLVAGSSGFAQGGMMGGSYGGMMGGGMMGAWDYIPPGSQKPLTLEQAVDLAEKYVAAWGDGNLRVGEVMEFSNHFYVEVAEKAGPYKAFELLLNKYTGAAFSEPGPNMLWNLKYGAMQGGMMGGLFAPAPGAAQTVSVAQAHDLAQKALDAQGQGLKVEPDADQFYGYYTIHVLKAGKVYGMLGVNAYTGQVWYHSWHGTFVAMKEVGGG